MTKITLDLNKSIEQNASTYFEKSKKQKKKLEGALPALEESRRKLARLERQKEAEESRVSVDAEVFRSTRLVVSQQRLYASLGMIFMGILVTCIALSMPPMSSTPFGPADDYSMRNIALLMGLGFIGFGALVYFLSRVDEESH